LLAGKEYAAGLGKDRSRGQLEVKIPFSKMRDTKPIAPIPANSRMMLTPVQTIASGVGDWRSDLHGPVTGVCDIISRAVVDAARSPEEESCESGEFLLVSHCSDWDGICFIPT